MADLDAIRFVHREQGGICLPDKLSWPCDTAIVLAALDAALARERRLRAGLDDFEMKLGQSGLGWEAATIAVDELRAALAETSET